MSKVCKKGLHEYEGRRCKECEKLYMAEFRSKNKDSIRKANLAYRIKNKDAIVAYNLEYRSNKPEKVGAYHAKYRAGNAVERQIAQRKYYRLNKEAICASRKIRRAKNPEVCKQNGIKWRKENPDKVCAQASYKRATKLRATPAWANKQKIEEFYYTANMLGMHTGEAYHVDHIVPLKSKLVCGLHWEGNLQILTAKENMAKGNRLLV